MIPRRQKIHLPSLQEMHRRTKYIRAAVLTYNTSCSAHDAKHPHPAVAGIKKYRGNSEHLRKFRAAIWHGKALWGRGWGIWLSPHPSSPYPVRCNTSTHVLITGSVTSLCLVMTFPSWLASLKCFYLVKGKTSVRRLQ